MLNLPQGLLLGAVVSSTDAAAVFSILETRKLRLKEYAGNALEFESATNDPMAMILTVAMTTYLLDGASAGIGSYLLFFIRELGLGVLVGAAFGFLLRLLFRRIRFRESGLVPSRLFATLSYAWLPTLFLFLVSRPLGVMISYLPFFRTSFRIRVFMSWVGIKGATPIVFALILKIAGVPVGTVIFNITAIIVFVSMIIHGFTLEPAARWLSLKED